MSEAIVLARMLAKIQDNCKLFGWKGISGFEAWADDGVYISVAVRTKSAWKKNKTKIKNLFKNKECDYLDKDGDRDGFVYWKLK